MAEARENKRPKTFKDMAFQHEGTVEEIVFTMPPQHQENNKSAVDLETMSSSISDKSGLLQFDDDKDPEPIAKVENSPNKTKQNI